MQTIKNIMAYVLMMIAGLCFWAAGYLADPETADKIMTTLEESGISFR